MYCRSSTIGQQVCGGGTLVSTLRANTRKPVCAIMRWSGRTARPSTCQPRTIVSLDCDGKIDRLVPIWLENGVNTMFPIEVGVWNASILPWREKYGREIRGVGGMDKKVFAYDYAAIDEEVERLRLRSFL